MLQNQNVIHKRDNLNIEKEEKADNLVDDYAKNIHIYAKKGTHQRPRIRY